MFGANLQDDVLSNITVEAMAPLLGSDLLARAAALAVRAGYLMSLMGSFVLLLFPLRHVLADVLLGSHDALTARWIPVTAAIMGTSFCTACFLPTIWDALTLVGATATTTLSWIIPALLILAVERRGRGRGRGGAGKGAGAEAEEGAGARGRWGGGDKKGLLSVAAEDGGDCVCGCGCCGPAASGSGGQGVGECQCALLQAGCARRRARRMSAARQGLAILIFVIGALMFANAIVGAVIKHTTAAKI